MTLTFDLWSWELKLISVRTFVLFYVAVSFKLRFTLLTESQTSSAQPQLQLEQVAIAIHCNFMPSDAAPVSLGFNYEAHNAPAYKFNNFAKDMSEIGEHFSTILATFVLYARRNCHFRASDQNSHTAIGFGGADIWAIDGPRASRSELFFWPNLYCTCAKTAIYKLSVEILTSPV